MDDAPGPVFRANKRRKVFRQRPGSDDEASVSQPGVNPSGASEADDGGKGLVTTQNRKSGNRKNGIAFSTNVDKRQAEVQDTDMAMVLADQSKGPEQIQDHRFVKPTGKTGVVDDRHMYVFA